MSGSEQPELTLHLEPGPWDPDEVIVGRSLAALLVTEGLLVREVVVGKVVSSELLGPGDVAAHRAGLDAQLPQEIRWTVATGTRVSIVDPASLATHPQWARMSATLLGSMSDQLRRGSVSNAIGHLPRVEDRVLALLWHLAERWGKVGRDGMIVPLDLTHEAIGRLVGARRPTVSLALKQLAAEGHVTRRTAGGWQLRPGSFDLLGDGGDAPASLEAPQRIDVPALVERLATANTALSVSTLVERVERLRLEHGRISDETKATIASAQQTRDEVSAGRAQRESAG